MRNATAKFLPSDILQIPVGGSRNLRVTIEGVVEADEDNARKIEVRLVDSDTFGDDILDSVTFPLSANQRVGDRITLTHLFEVSCNEKKDVGGRLGLSGESSAELSIEVGSSKANLGHLPAECVVTE